MQTDASDFHMSRNLLRYHSLAALAALVLAACSPKGDPQQTPSQGGEPTAAPPKSSGIENLSGAWATRDDQGQPFDVILFPNGQAVSTWTKGPSGPRGERGFWREIEGVAYVFFDDGWTDRIRRVGGVTTHEGFAPASSLSEAPTNSAPTERVEGDAAVFVGIWRLNREPDGSYLYLTLQSQGAAFSTINGLTEGRWEVVDDTARVSWPDGWVDSIERSSGAWQKRSWVGAAAAGTPADLSEAKRVGETAFEVAP